MGRTLHLGEATVETLILIKQVFPSAFIFPMGAVAKPLEPEKGRPTDDHTRTRLNAATDMTGLSHTLAHRGGSSGSPSASTTSPSRSRRRSRGRAPSA